MILLLLTGCLTQSLSPSWFLDRTRILAVAAEPAEPAPGDTVSFQSLVFDPDQDPLVLWAGCVLEDSDSFGCDEEDAGLLGFEPLFPPSLSVPEDLLADLTPEEQLEGKNYILTLSALAEDVDISDPESITEDDILEVAYKRLPVSTAEAPNHNPGLTGRVLVDDELWVNPSDTLVVLHGQSYDIDPELTEDAVETYAYVNSDGVEEQRVEEPYFTFYATDGTMVEPFTLYAEDDGDPDTPSHSAATWTAPVDPVSPEVTLWIVVRDRRGGMAWSSVQVLVE
ncbi:MAG: hypothetical protein H6741_11170 [Alphaproteobacteria bacterium]|nr:hypothetical protein [Alphaproteobacteria bacterium]MCB9793276.1 hypothetical protein [Alphaproteobacteria bacterium]